MDFIGNLIAGIYKVFLLALMQPSIWIHDGAPFFAIMFSMILIVGIIMVSTRVIWEKSGRTNAVAIGINRAFLWAGMLAIIYIMMSIPFMFGMA